MNERRQRRDSAAKRGRQRKQARYNERKKVEAVAVYPTNTRVNQDNNLPLVKRRHVFTLTKPRKKMDYTKSPEPRLRDDKTARNKG